MPKSLRMLRKDPRDREDRDNIQRTTFSDDENRCGGKIDTVVKGAMVLKDDVVLIDVLQYIPNIIARNV